jgi:hypothetical protein
MFCPLVPELVFEVIPGINPTYGPYGMAHMIWQILELCELESRYMLHMYLDFVYNIFIFCLSGALAEPFFTCRQGHKIISEQQLV